jgi:glycosyltransferase involved in cell wall biosynthesis
MPQFARHAITYLWSVPHRRDSGPQRLPTMARRVTAYPPIRRLIDRIRAATDRAARAVGGEAGRVASELSTLTKERRHDEAVALAQRSLRQYPDSVVLLRQARIAFTKAGALTLHQEATRALRRIADTPALTRSEQKTVGRLRETSADWRPRLQAPRLSLPPVSPGRVVHLLKVSLPYRLSGYSLRSKYTLEGQRAAGLDPVAITPLGFPRSIGVAEFPAEDHIGGVRHIRLDPGPDYDPDPPYDRYLEDYLSAAVPVVEGLAPAVIHAHSGARGYDSALIGIALARHFGLPVVYEVRGFFESLWTADAGWSERSEIYRRRFDTENRCMAEADAVVTLSESMRAEIIGRGIPAEKVAVVPNGVDTDIFRPRQRPSNLVDRFGLADRFVFGYVSNLDHPREGHELLIHAAIALRRRGVKATALIVGDGYRRSELERAARRLDAGDAVIFTGRVPHQEVLDYYALLDVFVVPRVDERAARLVTPLKPLEAMAAGVPLVTSDLMALREITGDGERGRHFPAGDGAGLADVLARLEADPAQRAAMAVAARLWVLAERQWSANGRRYADIYARLPGPASG